MREPTTDDLADEWADRQPSQACKCAGDMPGYCPGPASCPMCESDAAEGIVAIEAWSQAAIHHTSSGLNVSYAHADEDARVAADLANNRDKVERADVKAARDDAMMRHLLREVA